MERDSVRGLASSGERAFPLDRTALRGEAGGVFRRTLLRVMPGVLPPEGTAGKTRTGGAVGGGEWERAARTDVHCSWRSHVLAADSAGAGGRQPAARGVHARQGSRAGGWGWARAGGGDFVRARRLRGGGREPAADAGV